MRTAATSEEPLQGSAAVSHPTDMGHMDYGKSDIRLVRVLRAGDRHSFRDVRVDVLLEGRLRQGYVDGDNTDWMNTDNIRHAVYYVADQGFEASLEEFGIDLVKYLCETGPIVDSATVKMTEKLWHRIPGENEGHDHAFVLGAGLRTAEVQGDGREFTISAGITDLSVLKTTNSGWEGFLQNELTTLPATNDRILATAVTSTWRYADGANTDFDATWNGVQDQILATFGDHYSPGAQNDIYLIGSAVLAKYSEIESIHISLPNLHHIEYDMTRFGRTNEKRVFHAAAEPFGILQGQVVRSGDGQTELEK